jgi:ABC-type uncharacterized transport system YnjBCD permease subunit
VNAFNANVFIAMTLSIYIVVAIYSVVFTYRRLNRPGVSKDVRALFFRKHFYYVVVFTVVWSLQQSANFYQLFNPPASSFNDNLDQYMQAIHRAQNRAVFPAVAPLEHVAEFLGYRSFEHSMYN